MTEPMRDCPAPEVDQQVSRSDGPRAARQAVRPLGRYALPEWRRPDLDLLVSELVSNSLLHAGEGPISVRAAVRRGTLRVEVWDAGPGVPPGTPPMPGPGAHRGRGLPLVARLADRWGSGAAGGRSCVWFEMAPAY